MSLYLKQFTAILSKFGIKVRTCSPAVPDKEVLSTIVNHFWASGITGRAIVHLLTNQSVMFQLYSVLEWGTSNTVLVILAYCPDCERKLVDSKSYLLPLIDTGQPTFTPADALFSPIIIAKVNENALALQPMPEKYADRDCPDQLIDRIKSNYVPERFDGITYASILGLLEHRLHILGGDAKPYKVIDLKSGFVDEQGKAIPSIITTTLKSPVSVLYVRPQMFPFQIPKTDNLLLTNTNGGLLVVSGMPTEVMTLMSEQLDGALTPYLHTILN